MADREVKLRLNVDAGGLASARAGLRGVGDEAGKAAEQTKKLRGAFEGIARPGRGGIQAPGSGGLGRRPGGSSIFDGLGGGGAGQGDVGIAEETGDPPAAGAAGGPLVIAALAAAVALKKLADVAWQGVQLASPITMDRFNVAMEDTIATVGERFIPVVDFLTDIVRDVGDAFANLLPSQGEFKDLMGEAKAALAPLKDAFYEIAPLLKEGLTAAIRGAAIVVKWFGETIIKPAANAVREFAAWLGLSPAENRKSSAGAAVRDVTQINNLEDVFTQAARAGLMSGAGEGDPDRITMPLLGELFVHLEKKLEILLLEMKLGILLTVVEVGDKIAHPFGGR